MPALLPRLFACLGALTCGWHVTTLHAALTWPVTTIELQADPKSTTLEASFKFTNDGPTPVDVVRVQTSCGCTTATLAQTHYDSGQSGAIAVRYAVGEALGVQRKSIYVTTGDGAPPTVLTLDVHLPEFLHLQPNFVLWTMGEPNAAKTIAITPDPADTLLQDVSVQSSSADIRAELLASPEGGGKYQINLLPATTLRPSFTRLTIQCRVGGVRKTFHAFASVQPPPKTGSSPPGRQPTAAAPVATPIINE